MAAVQYTYVSWLIARSSHQSHASADDDWVFRTTCYGNIQGALQEEFHAALWNTTYTWTEVEIQFMVGYLSIMTASNHPHGLSFDEVGVATTFLPDIIRCVSSGASCLGMCKCSSSAGAVN